MLMYLMLKLKKIQETVNEIQGSSASLSSSVFLVWLWTLTTTVTGHINTTVKKARNTVVAKSPEKYK